MTCIDCLFCLRSQWVNVSAIHTPSDVSVPPNKLREWHELLYSMRSVHMHAPWVRTIYIVTASQVPFWLNTTHPRVRIIDHTELFPDPATQLPAFNSLSIESVLHRIPGLSEYFLYFNNDGTLP
jgi:hypothetical protein